MVTATASKTEGIYQAAKPYRWAGDFDWYVTYMGEVLYGPLPTQGAAEEVAHKLERFDPQTF